METVAGEQDQIERRRQVKGRCSRIHVKITPEFIR